MKKIKWLLLILFLLIIGATLVVGLHLFRQKKEVNEEIIKKEEGRFRLGGVNIDTEKGEIHFKGRVQTNKGWVQHLVYLEGYKWLKEESAIISEARLSDLQKAIALLDWKLWDELYYRRTENRKQKTENRKQKTEDRRFLLSLKWDEKEIEGQELVLTEDKLEIGDFIFLGSPYFDHIALDAPPHVDCRLCPIFPLEERALRELFIRKSGQSGYELNSERMPTQGTEVTVMIRIKNSKFKSQNIKWHFKI